MLCTAEKGSQIECAYFTFGTQERHQLRKSRVEGQPSFMELASKGVKKNN